MASALSSISDSYVDREDDEMEQAKVVLCGRTHETLQLLNAYHRVISNNEKSEIVVVHGESGSGKTALVEILRETACESNGYYVAGKYFQDLGIQEPYSAVMAAFSDLCDLVIQSEDFEQRRPIIRDALGDHGWLLAKTISRLSPFLSGTVENEVDIKNEVALAKFTIACKTFLRAMTSPEHPIVLVLDDIQWMDEGSRKLLEVLLSDSELKNVLLILTYRDEEQELALDLIQNKKSSSIHVDGLSSDGIHQIIVSRYKDIESSSKSEALSLLVYQRTRGNVFHVLGFLDYIESEDLLTLKSEKPAIWEFDVEAIKQDTMIVDTIADVLLRKIQRLPSEVHETLKIASLLGFRFEQELIANVLVSSDPARALKVKETAANVSASLKKAAQNGFIEKTSDGYQFCHDKFQSSFRSMIDHTMEPLIHKMIGEALLKYDSPKSRYHAAVHLNRAVILLINDDFDLAELARINLEASQYCKSMSFFFEATQLLKGGLQFVPEAEKWEKHYDLTLKILTSLAAMMLCVGEISGCERISQEILDNAKTIDDKLESFLTYANALGTQSKLQDTVTFGMKVLKDLGVAVPSKVSLFHVIYKMMQVNKLLAKRSDDDILNSPAMTDAAKSTAIRMLTVISATQLIQKKDKEGAFCSMLALQFTLKEGLSPYSAVAFATFSAMQMALGKHDKAARYGELAMKIGNVHSRADSDSVVIVSLLVSHWRQSLETVAATLDRSASRSFATGDISPGIAAPLWVHLLAGENLIDLEHLYKSFHSALRDLQQDDATIMWLLPSYQYVLNLRSENATTWRNLTELTGEVMTESKYVVRAVQSGEDTLWSILWTSKIQLEFHFGYHSAAETTFDNLKSYLKSALSYHLHAVMIVAFIGSLNSYAFSRERSKHQNLRKARRLKRYIEKLKVSTRPNIVPLMAILAAEDLSHQKRVDPDALSQSFNKAIEANVKAGFIHMEALANERAGFAFGDRGDMERAEVFFARAIDLYGNEYGAKNKAAWLKEKSQHILKRLKQNSGVTVEGSEFAVDAIQVSGPIAGGNAQFYTKSF